jgi:hypothetical protein
MRIFPENRGKANLPSFPQETVILVEISLSKKRKNNSCGAADAGKQAAGEPGWAVFGRSFGGCGNPG